MRPQPGSTIRIPSTLQRSVASIRGAKSDAAPEQLLVRLPTGASSLVVHVTPQGAMKAYAIGPNTVAEYKRIVPGPFFVQLVLQPGAARAIFGVPVHELADRVVDLEDLWGAARREAICQRDHVQETVSALERALLPRLEGSKPGAELARRATRALETVSPEAAGIPALARRFGVSERSLRQSFRDHVGVSPKRYARIARIRNVIARAGSDGWAHLAAEHGFFDQAHLYAEFRALLRLAPRAFLEGRFPIMPLGSRATNA